MEHLHCFFVLGGQLLWVEKGESVDDNSDAALRRGSYCKGPYFLLQPTLARYMYYQKILEM